MLKNLLIPADTLWYSVIAGANQYQEDGTEYAWLDGKHYPVIQNVQTAEQFHLRQAECVNDPAQLAFMTGHGVPEMFAWPADAAVRGNEHAAYRYVFRNLPASGQRSLTARTEDRNITDDPADAEAALRAARQIVQDARLFYACGYAYYGWDPDYIYPSADGVRLYYDFTGTADIIAKERPFPEAGRYKRLTDPAKTQYGADLDYFALMTLLFYVLIGKLPYDGRLMDGVGRAAESEQEAWYEAYRKNCVFIFDPHDSRNSVGTFAHEKMFLSRWEALPADVRTVFTQTFCGKQSGPNSLTVSPDVLMSRCAFFRGEPEHDQ